MTRPATGRELFSGGEGRRLWWSYQRYAIALAGGAAAIVVAIAVLAPTRWWLWLVAAVPVSILIWTAHQVAQLYPRKLRATALAIRRIDAGRFRPRSIALYCADPCFRVVASEILRRARLPPAERRRLIAELARSQRH